MSSTQHLLSITQVSDVEWVIRRYEGRKKLDELTVEIGQGVDVSQIRNEIETFRKTGELT